MLDFICAVGAQSARNFSSVLIKASHRVAALEVTGREIARGLCTYGADEVERIKGLPTREIERVLGYSNGDELIHRDNLVILSS